MQLGQTIRRLWLRVRSLVRIPVGDEPVVETVTAKPAPQRRWRKRLFLGAGLIVIGLVLIWPILALLSSKIRDDTAFAPPAAPVGGAHVVAMMAGLVEREVDSSSWVANAPLFVPASLLNNMPNFQIGMVTAIGRFAFELEDQIGRERGSSASDPDLTIARSRLQYEPTIWIFKPGSLWPTAPAEGQYKDAVAALRRYNQRLANQQATFDSRPDNLLAALDRIAYDLGAASAELETRVRERHKTLGLLDFKADKVFYRVKGKAYSYYMILRALRADFEDVIAQRETAELYDQMLDELRRAAQMQPLVVNNGTVSGQFFPNHLANQGFYILRARAKLRELTDILKK